MKIFKNLSRKFSEKNLNSNYYDYILNNKILISKNYIYRKKDCVYSKKSQDYIAYDVFEVELKDLIWVVFSRKRYSFFYSSPLWFVYKKLPITFIGFNIIKLFYIILYYLERLKGGKYYDFVGKKIYKADI